MIATANINTKAQDILISYSNSIIPKEEIVDIFLDHINENRKRLISYMDKINHLSNLLAQITWIEDLSENDEFIVLGLLAIGKRVDKLLRKFYHEIKKKYNKKDKDILKTELKKFDVAIKFHYETIKEVEYIISVLRKDEEFNDLCNKLNEI